MIETEKAATLATLSPFSRIEITAASFALERHADASVRPHLLAPSDALKNRLWPIKDFLKNG